MAMTFSDVLARPQAPAGPPRLTSRQLVQAQAETLAAPRLRYSMLAGPCSRRWISPTAAPGRS